MYETGPDPYCYPGTAILKNRLGLRDQAALDAFEALITAQRAQEPVPAGRLSYTHYRAIHRHLFQDVFAWAGRVRTIRTGKGDNWFCYPENIDGQMRALFADIRQHDYLCGLSAPAFASAAAHMLAELNAIHCFREGNGRTQLIYFTILAEQAGHPPDLDRMDPDAMLQAMIDSFLGNEVPLAAIIGGLIDP